MRSDASHTPVTLGRVEVVPVCEGVASIPVDEELPGRVVDWDAERALHPWAFVDRASWGWHVHAFAVRTSSGLVLVDSGLGSFPPVLPWARHIDPDAALRKAGVAASDVRDVVLTHLHADHAGGVATNDGAPRFANARVHVHEADRRHFERADGPSADNARLGIGALDREGLVATTAGDHDVVPGVRVLDAPGHTPGHRAVLVEDGADALLLVGDLLHLPVQVAHPEWPSAHDVDPGVASRSRRKLLRRAGSAAWHVGVSHFARPFGVVAAQDGRSVWRSTR